MVRSARLSGFVLGLLWFVSATSARAQNGDSIARASLAGISGVYVDVDSIDADAQRDGLFPNQLETEVELRLRQSGIPVMTYNEAVASQQSVTLHLLIATVRNNVGLYAYCVDLKVIQLVHLARNGSLAVGATWNARGFVGTVGASNLSSLQTSTIPSVVDQFINAYLAANPKR